MADEILKRDQNFVTVLAGVTDDSDQDITMLRVDPITKRLLINASGTIGNQNLQQVTDNGSTTTNSITASSLIKTGGLSTEFLKADGSVDSSTYLTTSTAASTYVPYTGATTDVALGAHTISTTSGLITPKIYPSADSTTAVGIYKADGTTSVLNVDTTNSRVGIGTSTPASRLTVNGTGSFYGGDLNIYSSNQSPTGTGRITWSPTNNGGSGTLQITSGSTGFYGYGMTAYTASGGMTFGARGGSFNVTSDTGTNLTVLTGGNVGINTTSPSTKLHVISTSNLLRFGYDVSNYFNIDVSSTGGVTFNAVGSGAGFTFSDPVNITSSLQCDSIVNDTGLASGVYTPTLTNVTNVAASTAYESQYMRVGNTVTVSGKVDIDQTASGAYEIGISLPIASNFGAEEDCAGVGAGTNAPSGSVVYIKADATNDRASFNGSDTDVSNHAHYYQFTYQVI